MLRHSTASSARAELRKLFAVASVAVRERATYRGNFMATLVTYGLFVFIFSRIWGTVYAGGISIAGYDRGMAIWYFIVAELSIFGLGRFGSSAAEEIKSGQVAYFLTRPFDYIRYNGAFALGPAFLETGLLAIFALAFGTVTTGYFPMVSPVHGLVVVVSLILAGLCQFLFKFALAMTAFWVEENTAFFWIFQKVGLVAGTLLPLELLPPSWRKVIMLTPFPSFTWAPARLAAAFGPCGGSEVVGILALQVAWLLGGMVLCRIVFVAGRSSIVTNGG